ncbi:MAG: methionine synthase [Candidatus Rokubacteria bacterium]|nr:methionine synthase [Candidatus Rokubacteria bacterium]
MTGTLPLLPTSVVGSHALPGWVVLGREAQAAGRLGAVDLRELIEDATRIAILDQLEAGIDVPANGEMGRESFTLGFFGRLTGLRALPTPRRLGVPNYDTHPPYQVVERLAAPDGLGLVEEWRMTRRLTDRPLRATCPGPLTLSIPLRHAGGPYRDRDGLLADLTAVVNAELRALVQAGADFIQVDEPNFVMLRAGGPDDGRERVALFNRTVAGVGAKLALHVCFGNLNNKPFVTPREYRPLFPALLDARCDQLVLEFASREMAELELLKEVADREVAVGVIDVKAYRAETPEDVAARLRLALRAVAPERLWVVPDCGLWETPRASAVAKLRAMVAGTRLVRRELGL